MKKTKILTAVFLLLIPLTVIFGRKLPGRSYYITSLLVILEIMIPFFLSFEGRKPEARELVLLAVLSALAIASRVVIPIPNFKATYAMVMLAGIALGAESGFLVGALTALVSNFFFGQGPHTPWQMMAYGAGGCLMGFLFRRGLLPRKRLLLGLFGAATIILFIGPLLDTSSVFMMLSRLTPETALAIYLAGFPVNCTQAVPTFLVLFFLGKPFLEKLDRVKLRYGMGDMAG